MVHWLAILILSIAPSVSSALSCKDLFQADSAKSSKVSEAANDHIRISGNVDRFLAKGKIVSILGSSRISDPVILKLTTSIARELGRQGNSIMTGGGPGIMDAANKGAREVSATSIGLELISPWPRHPTDFIDKLFVFKDLQTRKSVFLKYSRAWIVLPGGLGSLDEVFSIIGSIYSGQTPKRPVILVGSDFWTPLMDYIQKTLVTDYGTAKSADLSFVQIVNTAAEAVHAVNSDLRN